MALSTTLALEKLGSDYLVDRADFADELSQLFDLSLEVLSKDAELDLRDALGLGAKHTYRDGDRETRVAGIVAEAEQLTHVPEGLSRYRFRVVPRTWLATKRVDTRIFQDRSIPEIIADVYGFLGETPAKKLSREYEKREYTVQYKESDHAFVQRLAAEAGIGFFFDHTAESRMTLFDDAPADLAPSIRAPFRPQRLGAELHEDHVHVARPSLKLAPGKLHLRDFHHEKPALDLGLEHPGERTQNTEAALEVYEHEIGHYQAKARGDAMAAQILEELRGKAHTVDVIASFAAPAGTELVLRDHARDDLNRSFLVLGSRHRLGFGEVAENRLVLVAKDIAFRPARLPKPRIHGSQTAIVVGAEGEEIDVDEQGRVLVHFHWDRRPKSAAPTRRIRVSQGWAGAGYGFMMLPRIGDEVVVSYLDGDPDEPLIVGRVHNGTAPPPLKLPAEKTRSIWRSKSTPKADGNNYILFEDRAGKELVDVRAQLDLNLHAERHATISYGQNASEEVGANHTQTVGANHNQSVGGSQGVNVSGDRAITAGGALTETSASHTIESGPITASGSNIGINGKAKVALDAPAISFKGGASIVGSAPKITMSGGATATVTAPIAAVAGDAFAVLQGGAAAVVNGALVNISGGVIQISADAMVVVKAPSVTVSGAAKVDVNGAVVNVGGGGTVNVKAGCVAIN